MPTITDIEERIKARLNEKLPRPKYELLIRPMKIVEINADEIVIQHQTEALCSWVDEDHGIEIREILTSILGHETKVTWLIEHDEEADQINAANELELLNSSLDQPLLSSRSSLARPALNPRYIFDNFVVDSSNHFAYNSALSVAQRPGTEYNPFFIHSGVGLGKTHLLHAVGNFLIKNRPNLNVVYVPIEKFVTDFVQSVRNNTSDAFHQQYRNCDVLLIDDIQSLAGKEGTQEEFFHTFEYLVNSGHQVVITSDRPPKQLRNMQPRLVSRFYGGLIVDISEPTLDLRIAILKKKAALEKVHLPNDVSTFIAENIENNIRDLDGALTKLVAYSNYNRTHINLELATQVLQDLMPDRNMAPVLSIKTISTLVCDYLKVNMQLLLSPNKTKKVAFARMVVMYLSREFTNHSLAQIGSELGDRDHSTVIYAYNKISKEIIENPYVESTIKNLTRALRSTQ